MHYILQKHTKTSDIVTPEPKTHIDTLLLFFSRQTLTHLNSLSYAAHTVYAYYIIISTQGSEVWQAAVSPPQAVSADPLGTRAGCIQLPAVDPNIQHREFAFISYTTPNPAAPAQQILVKEMVW